MDRDRRPFDAAFKKAENKSRIAFLEWVKVVITIMTPSLVLLIGLQDKTQQLTVLSRGFLVSSIVLMSITILLGLLLLHSEQRGHLLLRNDIAHQWKTGGSLDQAQGVLPRLYGILHTVLSFLPPISIMSLSVFGVLKYT